MAFFMSQHFSKPCNMVIIRHMSCPVFCLAKQIFFPFSPPALKLSLLVTFHLMPVISFFRPHPSKSCHGVFAGN